MLVLLATFALIALIAGLIVWQGVAARSYAANVLAALPEGRGVGSCRALTPDVRPSVGVTSCKVEGQGRERRVVVTLGDGRSFVAGVTSRSTR